MKRVAITEAESRSRTAGAPQSALQAFADDVRRDLSRTPRRLRPQYFYDDLGSSLFAAICQLPWYKVTRAEKQLLEAHGAEILRGAGDHLHIVELGCGNGEKLRTLVEAACRGAGAEGGPREFHLVDVSSLALEQTALALASFDRPVVSHCLPYLPGLQHARASRHGLDPCLVLFLGSNIGNFDPPDALAFLADVGQALGPGDHLLLGVDLVKPPEDLLLAYDDPLGVTAAFNKNVLARINRELGADFDLTAFDHLATWNAGQSRVEMHLVSRRPQQVHIASLRCDIRFDADESIWTESSYKYECGDVIAMARLAGFDCRRLFVHEDARFASVLLQKRA